MPQHSIVKLKPRFNPSVKIATPPAHLDAVERQLFVQLTSEFEINDGGSISLLTTAMEAHQRARRARERINSEGETTTDRFGQLRMSQLITIESRARNDDLRSMKMINLGVTVK